MPRAGLNSEQVVDAAATLIDTEGLPALSLSTLAQRLGVKSPSLYAHVASLDDLRTRLATRAADQLGDTLALAAAGQSRGAALASIGHAYRRWALEHPGLYASIESHGQSGMANEPSVQRVLELILAVLRGYGLHGDDLIHAARSCRASLHGFITLETRLGFGIPVDPEVSFEWMLAALDRALTAAD